MIAGHVDDARAFLDFAQDQIHDAAMVVVPEPASAQTPAVDDIADEIECVAVIVREKIREHFSFAAARAQMGVGNKKSVRWRRIRCGASGERECRAGGRSAGKRNAISAPSLKKPLNCIGPLYGQAGASTAGASPVPAQGKPESTRFGACASSMLAIRESGASFR